MIDATVVAVQGVGITMLLIADIHEWRRYHRAKINQLHSNAENIDIFKRKYCMDRQTSYHMGRFLKYELAFSLCY